ncbi:MAG: peptidoglycan DD-metalloendopeptidase family protein [Anaerolineae bacterium]
MEPRTSRDEPLPVAGPMVAASARTASSRGSTGYLVRAAVPRTEDGQTSAPEATAQPQPTPTPEPLLHSYVVQEGDTVLGLARRYGITPETILSANSKLANDPDLLQLGEEIQIPAISGVLHVVAAGDTLRSIAERYKVGVEAIIGYAGNGLVEPYVLQPGQAIMVPGGEWVHQARSYDSMAGSPTTEVLASPTGSFVWPTTGTITQGCWAGHVAIDIGTASGTPIYASDAGYVTESGWSPVGYGQYVVIEHGNGFRTLYAHMSQRLVSAGETVAQGQRIGLVGSTGNSTGPHLHFEIYRNGVLQNPLNYLP